MAIVQRARAEPHDASLLIVYREHQAAAETIVYAALSLYEQAGPQKLFIAKAMLSQVLAYALPAGRAETEAEAARGGLVDAAAFQIRPGLTRSVEVGEKTAVPIARGVVGGIQPLSPPIFSNGPAAFPQAYSRSFRQHFQRLGELHRLLLHNERDDVTPRTAGAKAVPALPLRRHDERGGFLRVEGAICLHCASGLLQLHVLTDDINYVQSRFDFLDLVHGYILGTDADNASWGEGANAEQAAAGDEKLLWYTHII